MLDKLVAELKELDVSALEGWVVVGTDAELVVLGVELGVEVV